MTRRATRENAAIFSRVLVVIIPAPVVTTSYLKPDAGVKSRRCTGLADDLSWREANRPHRSHSPARPPWDPDSEPIARPPLRDCWIRRLHPPTRLTFALANHSREPYWPISDHAALSLRSTCTQIGGPHSSDRLLIDRRQRCADDHIYPNPPRARCLRHPPLIAGCPTREGRDARSGRCANEEDRYKRWRRLGVQHRPFIARRASNRVGRADRTAIPLARCRSSCRGRRAGRP